MNDKELSQLTKQQKNALEILKQWESKLLSQNHSENGNNSKKVNVTFDESNVNQP
ncbi:hypothetical protein ABE073_02755 [Lederbergia citrisecunda]|uniref:hypothetical protein n=1 Tax=Lederbergia citrisecunda TaxID=2833583 RepID=UPI003D2C706B